MKPVPAGFVDFLLTAQQMLLGEIYTFRLIDGEEIYFTNLDFNLGYNNRTWQANSVRFDNMKYHNEVGVRVDEMEIKASAYADDNFIGGGQFFQQIQQGELDGAIFIRERVFWEVSDGRPWVDYQQNPKGVITLFTGYVSEISKIGRTSAEIKVKSPLKFLDTEMPRNTFQASCNWQLYSAGCTLVRADFTVTNTVSSATRGTIDPVGGVSPVTGLDGIPYFQQGRLLFTSGVNAGLQTMMASNDGTSLFLQYPLVELPAPGDTFTASAGCIKTLNTCTNKFANLANFRGFPKVPPVHISI